MDAVNKPEMLKLLHEKIAACKKCPELAANRTQTVMDSGSPYAKICFVAEAPGRNEDVEGEVLVGKAGRLLTNIIRACGWDRATQTYLCNIVKCLDGSTVVRTTEGNKQIEHLYRTQYRGKVRCVDEKGCITEAKVLNCIRSPLGNRVLHKITLDHTKGTWKATGTFTNDHEMLTQRGWVRVDQLTNEDRIHSGTMQPSKELEPYFDSYRVEKISRKPRWVYCLEVENYQNFLTTSGVAHNCRPPQNRTPTGLECQNCMPFFRLQLRIVNPRYIICLGNVAAQNLLGKDDNISSLRGQLYDYEDGPVKAKVLCTYHPSYALRNGDLVKEQIWDDLQTLLDYMMENPY